MLNRVCGRSLVCRIAGAAALAMAAQFVARSLAAAADSKTPPADRAKAKVTGVEAAPSPEEKQRRLRLRLIAEGYNANKRALASGKWRISGSIWLAATLDDAQAGKWERPQPPLPDVVFSLRDDAVAIKTEVDDFNFVQQGRFAISQNGNSATIFPPAKFRFDVPHHPFVWLIDDASPATLIEAAEATNYAGIELTEQPGVVRDGREFLLLRKRGAADDIDVDLYLDRQQGYLPIIAEFFRRSTGELQSRRLQLEVRREGSGFVPTHRRLVTPRLDNGRRYVHVYDRKVTELDLAARVTDEDLTIQIPKLTGFHIEGNVQSETTLGIGKVSVSDILPLYERLEAVAATRRRDEPAGAARYAFGWMFNDTDRGRIRHGQFFGRTEQGQLLYLVANSEIQKELAIGNDQKPRLSSLVSDFAKELPAEMAPRGLTGTAIAELYRADVGDRAAKLHEINEQATALEGPFCEKFVGRLREILTQAQFRRLQEMRFQLGGSRAMDDATIVAALGLSAEQQARIATINREYDKSLTVMFSADLANWPDSEGAIFQELLTRVQKLAHARNDKARAVLTGPQQELLPRLYGKPLDLENLQ